MDQYRNRGQREAQLPRSIAKALSETQPSKRESYITRDDEPIYQTCGGGRRIIRKRIGNT